MHFLLTKLPGFKIINSLNLSTLCTALFEALYSAAKMGIMACKRQCVLRKTMGVGEKKTSCFEQSPLNYLFWLSSHEVSQKIK